MRRSQPIAPPSCRSCAPCRRTSALVSRRPLLPSRLAQSPSPLRRRRPDRRRPLRDRRASLYRALRHLRVPRRSSRRSPLRNVLSSDREGWLAIDPERSRGRAVRTRSAISSATVSTSSTSPQIAVRAMRRRVETVADLTGFDRERIREWALAQAVLSEIWTADDVSRASHVDLRAARLLHSIGPLG